MTCLLSTTIVACDFGRSRAASQTGTGDDGGTDLSRCEESGLDWRSGYKTHFTSYPVPGSAECEDFNGCVWEGLFAGCSGKQSEEWIPSLLEP